MTWEELEKQIALLSDAEKKKPIQVVKCSANGDHVNECMPVVAFDSVDTLGIYACRSIVDNERHGEDFVLLLDGNPHAECGAIAWEWGEKDFENPIYGEGGKTDPAKQRSQTIAEEDRDLPPYVLAQVESRIRGK